MGNVNGRESRLCSFVPKLNVLLVPLLSGKEGGCRAMRQDPEAGVR